MSDPETRSIEQQALEAAITAANAASDIPNVDVDRSWEIDESELGDLGAVILGMQVSNPEERQVKDDEVDIRAAAWVLMIWAKTRRRADAIGVRLKQILCCNAPVAPTHPLHHLVKRVRPGTYAAKTTASGNTIAEMQLFADFQQVTTDPTRRH